MEMKIRAGSVLMLLWILQGDTHRVEVPREQMEVVRGEKVVFHAWYSPTSDFSRNSVVWQFMGNTTKQVINFSSGEVGLGQDQFASRVGFSASMPSTNLSIYINNTHESDSGRYVCSVLIPRNPGLTGEIHLSVKVPPSPPVCSMSGDAVVKGNVTLTCKSSHGKPVPQYKWTKAAPVSEVFFSPMQRWRSCPQPLLVLGFLDERQGTLRLTNLTKNMSGKYVCTSTNTAGSDSCSINLDVHTSSNAALMAAAATLGSLVGLMAMVLFLVFILRRRRESEDDDIANEIKEDALAPKRASWAKSNTGSDSMSKNGTLSSVTTSPRPQDPHRPSFHFQYSPVPTSDGSVVHAYQLRPGEANALQGLPGYNAGATPTRKHKRPPCSNGALRSPLRTERAQPQVPPPLTTSPQTSSASLTGVGVVTVAAPAQSQAGSLV
ncbi:endothelial cell-selective adhesion molecule isoform X1 [Solea solea]|uniref:endothelial cell-selective adhesion molecule isoform X1 n=1 Tax=Solea solea TaxID=90069 RepID=UPI00272AF1D9|nr:endothelial cell-selective adhesion molecule isoform X1 [Solea solea]